MANTKRKTVKKTKTPARNTASEIKVNHSSESSDGFLGNFKFNFEENQSYINMALGALIVIVLGILIFNYFNKPSGLVGPSGQTQQAAQDQNGDVAKNNLPGKYTVKEGDTLSIIAQNYYGDAQKFSNIAQANNITDINSLKPGQVLEIPKLSEDTAAMTNAPASTEPSPSTATQAMTEPSPSSITMTPASPQPTEAPQMTQAPPQSNSEYGQGGATNQTIWGEKITGDTYIVQSGDWLSKISGRAYGDIYAYQKIAQANNIQNPDQIEPGTVLKIPK